MSASDWAAWVQAVGVMLGIAVAIYVPWRQTKDRRVDEERLYKLQGHSLAIAVFPAMHELQARIEALIVDLKACSKDPNLFTSGQIPLNLQVPAFLLEARDRMHLLGDEAGTALQQAVAVSVHHGAVIGGLKDGLPYHTASGNISPTLDQWLPFLQETQQQLEGLKKALLPLHDTPVL